MSRKEQGIRNLISYTIFLIEIPIQDFQKLLDLNLSSLSFKCLIENDQNERIISFYTLLDMEEGMNRHTVFIVTTRADKCN